MGQCAVNSSTECCDGTGESSEADPDGGVISRHRSCSEEIQTELFAADNATDSRLKQHLNSDRANDNIDHAVLFAMGMMGKNKLSDASGDVALDAPWELPFIEPLVAVDANDNSADGEGVASGVVSYIAYVPTSHVVNKRVALHEHDGISGANLDSPLARILEDEWQKLQKFQAVACQVDVESKECHGLAACRDHSTVSQTSSPSDQLTCWSGCFKKSARLARACGLILVALVDILLMAVHEAVTGEEHIEVTLARGTMSKTRSRNSLVSIPEEGEEGDEVPEVRVKIVDVTNGFATLSREKSLSTMSTEAAMSELYAEEEVDEDLRE